MAMNELEMFLSTWDREAENTVKLLRALPATQYDFRPDPGGRSLGELAWHLAEGDAYISYGIDVGQFTMDAKPPNIERPNRVANIHSCRRSPAWPNGASRDCGSPVPKPSREIEKLWILVCDIEFDPSVVIADSRRAGVPVVTLTPEEPRSPR